VATSSVIKVMLSSRCGDKFPLSAAKARTLSAIRADLKRSIQVAKPLGHQLYEVWINEDHTGDGAQPAWDHCMDQAADCDIFIALFNGNAGWEDSAGTVGICHAELEKAHSVAPGKVFIVNIFQSKAPSAPARDIDIRFQQYVGRLKQFEARNVTTETKLVAAVRRTLSQATVRMVQRGVQGASLGTNHVGAPLDWSRLSYARRAERMRLATLDALKQGNPKAKVVENSVGREIADNSVLFVVGAIPDAMSVPAAREVVGRPHLLDHKLNERLEQFQGGPVHVVACHKGNTESQARAMLGFPDATVVSAPFGIYVADPVQSIQLVLIAQCRDETSTRIGVQRFLEWLEAAEQADDLVRQARKRKSVVKVLAGES
jgi:hypothetical protein